MGRPPLRLGRPKGRPQAPFQPSHENRYPFTNWSTFAPPKWSKFTPPLTRRVEHTLEAARRCKRYGVIPEFSFILGGPSDPEGEIDKTFEFIRRLKTVAPAAEIILYFYSPTPQREPLTPQAKESGLRLPVLNQYGPSGPDLPATPEEWTQPQWVSYVCHEDAPWLTERTRRRVKDFATVLGCRFPTEQDYETPRWRKAVLKGLARWRFRTRGYGNPWELRAAQRLIPLRKPQRESL